MKYKIKNKTIDCTQKAIDRIEQYEADGYKIKIIKSKKKEKEDDVLILQCVSGFGRDHIPLIQYCVWAVK